MSDPRPMAPAQFRPATRRAEAPAWLGGGAQTVRPAAFPRVGAEPEAPRVSRMPSIVPPPPPAPVLVVDPVLEAQLLQTIRTFGEAAASLAAAREGVLASVEQDLVELALAIASTVIEHEIARDPKIHVVLAHAALATIGDPQGVRLRASRPAYEAIVEVNGGSKLSADGVSVEVVLDETLEGLGVVAEGDAARVDGRIHERLRAVMRALQDEHIRSSNEDA